MAKSLLILMLMTTQLLAGSGGSLYLCVSNDGSYCCIDTGPASCTCCHDHEKIPDVACCSDPACEDESAASSCEHHQDEAPQPRQIDLLVGDPCGCTHVPVMISSDQPTTVARSSITAEAERLSLQIAFLSAPCVGIEVAAPAPPLRWSGPPAVADFALTVISTVVIRC
jgi:hypothetical protein